MFGDGARCLAGITAAAAVAFLAPAAAGGATITVNTTEDSTVDNGNCALREAILAANKDARSDGCRRGNGRDLIAFDISAGTFIPLTSQLPDLKKPVTIDGTTEPDYLGAPVIGIDGGDAVVTGLEPTADDVVIKGLTVTNFIAEGIRMDGDNGRILANRLGVNGAGMAQGNAAGVAIEGDGNRIGGGQNGNLISGNQSVGVLISGDGNRILKNKIGTNAAGGGSLPNPVGIDDGGAGTQITGNVVSGNSADGMQLGGRKTVVRGNFVGLRADGDSSLPNADDGISIDGVKTEIGGTKAKYRNVISANGGDGIEIGGTLNTGERNRILGNYIGTDADGTDGLGNFSMGVRILGPGRNLVGGDEPAEANVLSDNVNGVLIGGGAGVTSGNVVSGNLIGTDATGENNLGNSSGTVRFGTNAQDNVVGGFRKGEWNLMRFTPGGSVSLGGGTSDFGNSILGNSAFENGEEVIDLGENGVTPNDAAPDADTGPNHLQNFPVLIGANEQQDRVVGDLETAPLTRFRIEYFTSPDADDAKRFVGAQTVKTDGDGHASVNFKSQKNLPAGDFITATATLMDGDDPGDTSELSDAADISIGP